MNQVNHVLLPVCEAAEAIALLPLARAIAQGWGSHVLLFGIVHIPQGRSLSEGALPAQELRRALAQLAATDPLVDMLPTAKVTHTPWDEIAQQVDQAEYDLLLLRWPADQIVFGADLRDVLVHLPCDVAMVRPGESAPIRRIMLPIRGGPHAELALRVSLALAQTHQAEITALHVAPPASQSAEDVPFANLAPVLQQLQPVTRIITLQRRVQASILDEAHRHDLIVMGATARPKTEPIAVGDMVARVLRSTRQTVIAVKTRREMALPVPLSPQPAAEPEGYEAISILVDKWFAENTFHSHEFEDLNRLVELKQAQKVTISLGLPALNEEKTVGHVIATLKRVLMDAVPLLDEIVLIDSNSIDRTRRIGERLGVPVHIHQHILPQHGANFGKGEALWKSLYVLRGDIVAWIDTDITNIHPRFVYGLLGPLLRESRIQYVKGFYRRPLRVGDQLQAGGGGRVTELVARPMLNLFYPELSGMVQPLSGEYAGRRAALEQLPFFAGYGVEIGLLIDLLDKFGLQAIAQCDLEERIHKNQELPALGKMSFQILQVFIRRLESRHGPMVAEVNKSIKILQHEHDRFYLDVQDIREIERPPMLSLPEYRRMRGLGDEAS
jgi:glycosyltransferase involved in cell wall biosynthesis/nucleotide-binding universal stress UspA family protein